MLLIDAVHVDAINAIETIFGVWLGMSAVAFILLGLSVKTSRESQDLAVRHDVLVRS